MKIFFIPTLLFFSLVAEAQRLLLKNESVIISFTTNNGKQVVLAKDSGDAYIVYRYGTINSIEFEYPKRNKDSWKKFKYAYYMRGGGDQNEGMDLNYLHFTNRGYKYSIYDTYYATGNESAIGIHVTNLKTKKTTDIKGIEKSKKGTMIGFRENGLVEIEEVNQ